MSASFKPNCTKVILKIVQCWKCRLSNSSRLITMKSRRQSKKCFSEWNEFFNVIVKIIFTDTTEKNNPRLLSLLASIRLAWKGLHSSLLRSCCSSAVRWEKMKTKIPLARSNLKKKQNKNTLAYFSSAWVTRSLRLLRPPNDKVSFSDGEGQIS